MTKLFRRVLVPHDFSESATVALRVAANLAVDAGGRLTVLHVLGPFYTGPGYPTVDAIAWTPTRELVRDLQTRLAGIVARALGPRQARRAECRVVTGEPLELVLAAARRADSIVMSTIGRTGLAHVLIGSVAEKIVRHSPVPVLTVRPSVPRQRRALGTQRRRRRTVSRKD
jgi:universal stress protein A